jgi:hypothetical protein
MKRTFLRGRRVHFPRVVVDGKAQALCWDGDPKHGTTIPSHGWSRFLSDITCHQCLKKVKTTPEAA